MSFDFQRILQSKRALRERLAAKPVAEKLRLLDAMRERAVALRAASARKPANIQEQAPDYGKNS